MNEHTNHDLELLAAHASGHEPDRAAAEALLSSCGECRGVYEEQLQIRSLLLQSGLVRMSAAEDRKLLSAVGSAFPPQRLQPKRPEPRPLSPVWGRVMAAAAALAVVVGVGATVATQQLDGGAATTAGMQTAAAPEFAAGEAGNDERGMAATTAAEAAELLTVDEPARLKNEAEALADDATAQDGGTATTLAGPCSQTIEDLSIRARGESTYQDRRVLLFLAEDEGELSPRAFFADDCTEIPLP